MYISLSPFKIFNSESIPDLETAAQTDSILMHAAVSLVSVRLDLATLVMDPHLNYGGRKTIHF